MELQAMCGTYRGLHVVFGCRALDYGNSGVCAQGGEGNRQCLVAGPSAVAKPGVTEVGCPAVLGHGPAHLWSP